MVDEELTLTKVTGYVRAPRRKKAKIHVKLSDSSVPRVDRPRSFTTAIVKEVSPPPFSVLWKMILSTRIDTG